MRRQFLNRPDFFDSWDVSFWTDEAFLTVGMSVFEQSRLFWQSRRRFLNCRYFFDSRGMGFWTVEIKNLDSKAMSKQIKTSKPEFANFPWKNTFCYLLLVQEVKSKEGKEFKIVYHLNLIFSFFNFFANQVLWYFKRFKW